MLMNKGTHSRANWSIRAKVLANCLFLGAISGVIGFVGHWALDYVSLKYQHIATVNLPNANALASMRGSFREIRIHLRTLGLPGLTPEQVAQSISSTEDSIANYLAFDKAYNDVPFVEGEAELYKQVNEEWKSFRSLGEQVIALAKSKDPGDRVKMTQIFLKDCPESASRYYVAIEKLIDFQSNEARKWVQIATSAANWVSYLTWALVALGLTSALVIGWLFSNALSKTLKDLADRMLAGANEVASATRQISASSAGLSESATEQASSLEETASSIHEMSAAVSKNAENAQKSSQIAQTGHASATRGKQAVDEMIRAIEQISESNAGIMRQIDESNREISNIVKMITEIGEKTKVINDIVFQTKLLSFNASVEAARAGENGKGFAVVAEEVGNLAQMSGNASKEISSMLEESIEKVQRIVSQTKTKVEGLVAEGKQKVDSGTQIARRCGEVLGELVNAVSQVNGMIGEISVSSDEQARGVQEITKAIGQLDQVTQQNASAAHQAASATLQLSTQADMLRTMVETLGKVIDGATPSSRPTATQTLGKEGNGPKTTMPKIEASAASTANNVIPMQAAKEAASEKKKKKKKPTQPSSSQLLATGTGTQAPPLADDPRFKDI